MDNLKKIGDNQWWDADKKTLYVRQNARQEDLAGYIIYHRQELAREPDDFGTRYMLAACLYGDGQIDQARLEWEQVAASEDVDWVPLAQEALERLERGPIQP